MNDSCPSCGKVYKRSAKMAEHIAAIPALCDQTTRHWRREHGVERTEIRLTEVKTRPEPDPNNPWSFWQMQLAGEEPSDVFGPHWGFWSLQEWIAPTPPERKKQPVHWPVAIWQQDGEWQCVITRSWGPSHLTGVMNAHEIFARCNRDAISHEEYLKRVEELQHEPS